MRKPRSPRRSRAFAPRSPAPTVYVYDNNSSDRTVEIARGAGAIVRTERQQGKGHVVRRMFADVDADIYVMADGDLTYDPKAAPAMVAMLVDEQLDMVVGTRQHEVTDAYRGGHVLGNKLFTGLLAGLFGRSFSDIFSGYRDFLAALRQELPRAVGGVRDRDRDERPRARAQDARRRTRHGLWRAARGVGVEAVDLSRRLAHPQDDRGALPHRAPGAVLRLDRRAAAGRAASCSRCRLLLTYLDTGLVPRFPTAILITGMTIVAVLCFFAGLILDTVTRGRREVRRLAYLSHPAPNH